LFSIFFNWWGEWQTLPAQCTISLMKVAWTELGLDDQAYPALLKEIHDPPSPLYLRGTLDLQERVVVAVVGSRRATSYGRQAVERLITPLAEAGVVIVSGLAFGIDGAAHEAALKGGGVTIGVLGTPIDQIYPSSHRSLAERMVAAGGAILSEILPGGEIHRGTFPRRNRIIAGMCQATIVIEAALQSGSLITAGLALAENREVLAVPGPITSPTSIGTNNLLKLGARPITEANDVLALLNLPLIGETVHQIEKIPPDPALAKLLSYLSPSEPLHIDNLARSATINLPILQGQLTMLEIQGYIKMVQPGYYIRI
jgi:DNA processing protein